MTYRAEVWAKWDEQEQRRIELREMADAYIRLNNLYLRIERGATELTIHTANMLRCLYTQAYGRDHYMRDYWQAEFEKLPGWLEV